ncbi:retrovirus-related pol polyprotein from transposon TNT 1-94 [Tanacetum coccineum]
MIDSQMDDMIKEKLALKEQVDSLKQNLSKQIKEKESLLQTFTVLKNESKEMENKYMENEIDLEKKIKELDNIIYKVCYQNPFNLYKDQRIKPTLYDGIVISDKHVAMLVIDDEETLILEEDIRSKMSEKEKDPEAINQNISNKPIDYEKLNRLSEDFGKRFTLQQELSAEQAFWFHMSNPTIESSDKPPVKVEVPSELLKVSLVNEILKKLKFHLALFDSVVKKRTTPNARTEGEWGFEHTKVVFNNEIIPFLKSLKDIFNVFDKDLLNEIMEVQTVFDQIEYMILSSADNRLPMLDKDLYDSWKSRMELYMQNREHGRMILESSPRSAILASFGLGPRKIQADCDMKAINISLQGLSTKIYLLVNHHRPAKDLWERVQLLMQGDDPIACLNKAMAFLTAVASSRLPSTNNQLRTSSNLRNQATIQDGRVIVQQVQRRQGQSYSGNGYKGNATSSGGNNASGQARIVKCYNCQGEGHMARQCTQPKRPRNASWYKEKAMLAEAQKARQILDEEQLTEDLNTYDSDCDDLSNAQAVLMANISNYGYGVILEVPHSETYLNDMENQSVHALQDFEQPPAVNFTDNEIHSDSNIIPYS